MVQPTLDQIRDGICEGIQYLAGSHWQGALSFDALFFVRHYLWEQLTAEAYTAKFPHTYSYDDHGPDRTYYSDDGCLYYGSSHGQSLIIANHTLFGDKEKSKHSLPLCAPANWFRFTGNNGEYRYYYLNEIDHFFSYWIVKYLLNKPKTSHNLDIALSTLMWQDLGIDFPTRTDLSQ